MNRTPTIAAVDVSPNGADVSPNGADVRDYLAIHGGIRRVTRALTLATADDLILDDRRANALRSYWEGYATDLHMHHTAEDTVFFPALVDRDPSVAPTIARMDAEHTDLDHLIAIGHDAFDMLCAGRDTAGAHAVMVRLEALMTAHLDVEDRELVPRFAELFDQEEYEAMHQRAIRQPTTRKQLAFVVPFIAMWSDAEAWERLWASAPLPMRLLYRVSRRGHARLARAAFGDLLDDLRP
jgi:hemerythrin-like domain-containing protein